MDAATNWAQGFYDSAPSRITGAVNGSFYWFDQGNSGPTYIVGDLWEKNYGGWMSSDSNVRTTQPPRWSIGFNELGSQYGLEEKLNDDNYFEKFDYARTNVMCMLNKGTPEPPDLGNPLPNENDRNWRTLLVWGSSVPDGPASGTAGKEFFLICAELESWNTLKDFLKPGGVFCQTLMKPPYNIRLNVDTIIWLDGGSSSQIR